MKNTSRYYAPEGSGETGGSQHDDLPAGATSNEAGRNLAEEGPSGENTKNNGERGGGLYTSGGQVTSGTPYHGEYGKPEPTRDALTKEEREQQESGE